MRTTNSGETVRNVVAKLIHVLSTIQLYNGWMPVGGIVTRVNLAKLNDRPTGGGEETTANKPDNIFH